MQDPSRKSGQRHIRLRNLNCVYCGNDFTPDDPATREHVIGRRFVPKGTLKNSWNLILNACRKCNHSKSQLEDDISAITMLSDATGHNRINSIQPNSDTLHKANNSISRKTKRSVAESQEHIKTKVIDLKGMKITANFVAPPQIDTKRIHELAYLHALGFFFYISYSEELRKGYFFQGVYQPVSSYSYSNWGDPLHLWFMSSTENWNIIFKVDTASSFFKAIIRKSPEHNIYSFAVEWNSSMRVTALLGTQENIDIFLKHNSYPEETRSTTLNIGENESLKITPETALDSEDDNMFPTLPTCSPVSF